MVADDADQGAKGNALAIYDLGKLYATDKARKKNDTDSKKYYTEALAAFMNIEPNADYLFPYEPKYAGQQMKPQDMRSYVWYRIGKMYCYGLGTEQDYAEAFKWFEKSATEGNKFAQFNLALMYLNGEGVKRNREEAVKLLKLSAGIQPLEYRLSRVKKGFLKIFLYRSSL